MSKLTITLLGTPKFQLNNKPIPQLNSRKAKALLIYLALMGQSQSREKLAGLLWGDFPEEKARTNLRGELRRLRTCVSEHILTSRYEVAFDNTSEHMLDVVQFQALTKQPNATVSDWETAVSLYKGPFLDSFYLPDAPEFDQWAASLREQYRRSLIQTRYNLAIYYTNQHQYATALTHAQELLHIEPWYEEAHRQIMLLLALEGQRAAALDQYQLCKRILDEEFGVPPSSATQELFYQIESEAILPDETAETYVPTLTAYQAPPVPAHFVGRQQEIETAVAHITASQTPSPHPIALIGMGGLGKTTLAARIAQELKPHFKDGILWAKANTPDANTAIVDNWSHLFGHDFSALKQTEQKAAALRGLLANKQALLIFDDVSSVETIRPLLPANSQCKILLTTRSHEAAAALNAYPIPIQSLPPNDSLTLLTNILGSRVTTEPEAARELCHTLHHFPLALEITAQLLTTRPRMTLHQMASRLRDVNRRLNLRISDRAVRASFEMSWESLPMSLQTVFATLGIFTGRHFTADALAYLVDTPVPDVEDALYRLVSLSLLQEDGKIAFRQHPLLADFSQEKLTNPIPLQHRYVDYYIAYARQHKHHYPQLSLEWENLTTAVSLACQLEQWQNVLTFARTLQPAWTARGRYDEALHSYQLAEKAAIHMHDDTALADTLLQWGKVCIERGEYETAVTLLTKGQIHARQQNNHILTAAILNTLARVALEQTRYDMALSYLEQSRPLLTQTNNEKKSAKELAKAFYLEARVLDRKHQHREVRKLCQKALTLQQETNDDDGKIQTLQLLARTAIFQESYSEAEALCQQAMSITQERGDKVQRAQILYTMSVLYTRTGQLDKAQTALAESIQLFDQMGNQKMIASAYHALSGIEDQRGNLQQALKANARSAGLFQSLQDKNALVYVYQHRAQLLVDMDALPEANAVCHRALSLAEPLQHPQLAALNNLQQQIHQRMGAA
ncbi:MAG: BTAD domain-containing putative transcriptional regulator [Candidatus Promineifilaceae bacterium]